MTWPVDFVQRYRDAGYWTEQILTDLLTAADQEAIAVIDGDRQWSYGELTRRAQRMAAGFLRLGIRAGDRVVVQLPNIAEYFEVIFGLFRIGALPVFALPAHRIAEIGYFCDFTEAKAYISAARPEYQDIAAQLSTPSYLVGEQSYVDIPADDALPPPPSADQLAFLQLSGGTTGTPKFIPRTHADYLYSVRESARICALDENSVYLTVLPVAHNFPMSSPGVLGVFHAGGTVVLAPSPDPATVFTLIARHGVTITAVVPPLALALLRAAATTQPDLATLRLLQVGGAKLSATAASRIGPELGVDLQQVFGMAEGLVNYTRLDDPQDVVVHTQGRPISPDDEIRIVAADSVTDETDIEVAAGEEGQLLTRGPYTIRGYWRAPEHNAQAFTADGFYRTGDLVRRTPEGNIVVTGRIKDQINRGGEKIAAEEIENGLLTHPQVHDAAVVAMPDDYLGERSCAFVVPLNETKPSAKELRKFLRAKGFADYKLPDAWRIVDHFPDTAVGKVAKAELRRRLAREEFSP